jgi:ABC-2 type transport system ATP-binding protein
MSAVLVASSVGVTRSGRELLARVDLRSGGGSTAILGPNGSGKTTLLRCLATVMTPDTGQVTIDGLDARREHERIEARRRLGYLPQQVGLVEGSRAFDTVEYLAVLKGMTGDRQRRAAVFEALDRVGLSGAAGERVEHLSGGMQRRLGLAQALLGSPTLLVFDEPTAGLDPDERLRFRAIVHSARESATVVVATHLIDEAANCDEIVVLIEGEVAFRGTPQRLAAKAQGHTWISHELPPPDVRASWRQTDGSYRCLGTPPPGAATSPSTLEDGYLMISEGVRSERPR